MFKMITLQNLKNQIKEARTIEGNVYIAKSQDKVCVYSAPSSFHSVRMAHNFIYFWFRPSDIGFDGKVTVNNRSPQEEDFTFTLQELVDLANSKE